VSFRLKKYLASFFLATALAVVPAVAQESHEAARGHETAVEHEGGEHEGMEVWKWANFAILAAILGYLISKNVAPMLVARSAEIRDGLAAGEKAKAEADARAAAVDARLAGLEKTIAGLKAEAREEREREADRIRKETQREMARLERHAQSEMESASKLASLEVKRHAARLALDLAEQKLKARMSPDAEATLLKQFLTDVSTTAPEARQ
jgi:F-type H+-transporting ATPase subunit b